MSVFDILKNISTSQSMMDWDKKDYNQFVINKGLSYFVDTIMQVNEMNQRFSIDNHLHYIYLHGTIRKRKRFSKWHKKTVSNDVDVIATYYKYNQNKAEEALKLLTPEQVSEIKSLLDSGDNFERTSS